MILIAYLFPKLPSAKEVLRQMSKMSCFRKPFDKRHSKGSETVLKSAQLDFYHIHWSLQRRLSWKKSLLVICKILGLSVNTLTAGEKYSLPNCHKLTQPIQMQLSKKKKFFFNFFLHFWSLDQLQNILKKNMTLTAYVFAKLGTMKDVVRQMSKKSCFGGLFEKRYGKRPQTLLKSVPLHFHDIHWSLRRQLSKLEIGFGKSLPSDMENLRSVC